MNKWDPQPPPARDPLRTAAFALCIVALAYLAIHVAIWIF